jgi:hypothetical protein
VAAPILADSDKGSNVPKDWKQDLANAAQSLNAARRGILRDRPAESNSVPIKRTPEQWAAVIEAEDRHTLREVSGVLRLYERNRLSPGEAVKAIQDLVF